MAKTWQEVEKSEKYLSLSPRDRIVAKKQYWNDVVSSKQEYKFLSSDEQSSAKQQFFGGTLVEDLPNGYFKSPNLALTTIGDTLGTIAKSTGGVISGAVQPILHPINTAKSIGLVAKGAIEKMIPGTQINEKYVDAIGKFYKDRYGSVDGLADTVANDPVGFLTDMAGIGAISSGVIRSAGKIAKSKAIESAGSIEKTTSAVKSAIKSASDVMPKIDFTPETKIFKAYNVAFPSTKKTIGDLKRSKDDIVTAVKAIDDNFPEEGIAHPLTGEVISNKPSNRYEMLLALDNAKRKIWEKASKLSEGATESGALIDIAELAQASAKDSIKNFGKVAAYTTKKGVASSIIDEAKSIAKQGKITPTQAEEFMKTLYDDSQRLMQSGDFAQYSKKDFYKDLYGKLRTATDNEIEKTLGKSGYSFYRNQYSAVRKAEDAIKAGANRYLKANQGGASGALANFWALEEALSGNIGKSVTVKATSELLKYIKNPDRKVSDIFKAASKIKSKEEVIKPGVFSVLKRLQ